MLLVLQLAIAQNMADNQQLTAAASWDDSLAIHLASWTALVARLAIVFSWVVVRGCTVDLELSRSTLRASSNLMPSCLH